MHAIPLFPQHISKETGSGLILQWCCPIYTWPCFVLNLSEKLLYLGFHLVLFLKILSCVEIHTEFLELEAEAEGSWVQAHPTLHSIVCLKKKKQTHTHTNPKSRVFSFLVRSCESFLFCVVPVTVGSQKVHLLGTVASPLTVSSWWSYD